MPGAATSPTWSSISWSDRRGYRGAIPTLREFHTRWTDPVLFALFIYIAGMLLFLERIETGPRYL